ncbi:hypothetical protein J2S22_003715 [Rhodoplanes tepidamans]|nr:hypothetical protein [Rhodoplanes tepidamans]
MTPDTDPVMAGLVPAIHDLPRGNTARAWMSATSAGTTAQSAIERPTAPRIAS